MTSEHVGDCVVFDGEGRAGWGRQSDIYGILQTAHGRRLDRDQDATEDSILLSTLRLGKIEKWGVPNLSAYLRLRG